MRFPDAWFVGQPTVPRDGDPLAQVTDLTAWLMFDIARKSTLDPRFRDGWLRATVSALSQPELKEHLIDLSIAAASLRQDPYDRARREVLHEVVNAAVVAQIDGLRRVFGGAR